MAEGHRTALPAPLAPGASVRLRRHRAAAAVPGDYELCLTLVQEHFAWLDEIDAGLHRPGAGHRGCGTE